MTAELSRFELDEVLAWAGTEKLVGAVAHELGNELGVILNYATFVTETQPHQRHAAHDTRRNSELRP